MSAQPNFGPYSSWESIAAFETLSEKAFTLFERLTHENWDLVSQPTQQVFMRMEYQAKTTSFGIRLNNSWAMCLPAFAMTRIRLEQTIVCSYLLHEDESEGFGPYIMYIPIGHYKRAKAAMEDPLIARILIADLTNSDAEVVKAQEMFTPGFSLEKDKLERNWTKLDLRSMAKKRDTLVRSKDIAQIWKEPLEREYLTIYKVASSIIHSEGSSISYHFLDLFQVPPGPLVLMAKPTWAFITVACTAHYDILQCYEILDWFGISANQEYEELMQEWFNARNKYISSTNKCK